MAPYTDKTQDTSDREIKISRVVAAPRPMVWDAMTDPEQVVKWWGPVGFTSIIEKMDFRVGGTWKHIMRGPDGTEYPNKSTFLEIEKPERIVYVHGGGRKGQQGVSFVSTWTFEVVEEGQTKVTIHMVFHTPEDRERVVREFGAIEGGKQTLARLDEYAQQAPLVVERVFNAPAPLIWKALTDIAEMKKWYFPMLTDFKAEVGFETSFTVTKDGKEYPHLLKVTEVVPGEKITYRWKYGGYEGESFVTFALAPEKDQTRLTLTHVGLASFQPDKFPLFALKNFSRGWTYFVQEALPTYADRQVVPASAVFTLSREYAAPKDVVFKAWTDPEAIGKWWGPAGFDLEVRRFELRPGGTFHYGMRAPNGHVMWGKKVYRSVDPSEELIFVVSFSDEKGGMSRHPASATWPLEMLNIVTFTEKDGKTTVKLEALPINATEEEIKTFTEGHSSMQKGFSGTLDKLGEFLAQSS